MFQISDHFSAFDANKQPYSFTVERHTETANLHAGVTKRGFSLKSIGNRYLLNAPAFLTGTFTMDFMISYPVEIPPVFYLLFAYDEKHRCGSAVQITYRIGESLSAVLVAVKNGEYTEITEPQKVHDTLTEGEWNKLSLEIEATRIKLHINEAIFLFPCDNVRGKFGIDRNAFIGELLLKDFTFHSEDTFEQKCISETEKLAIPLTNGGDIPYTIKYKIEEIENEFYLTASLDDGTKSRAVNKQERLGQYVAEIDWMTSPYVGLFHDKQMISFSLAEGENCFVDPNIFWDCQKTFFHDRQLPLIGFYKLNGFVPNEQTGFLFGYENLLCKGYDLQAGGSEFRFSHDGKLLSCSCNSAPNSKDTYELRSPFDKKAISLIPDDCYNKAQVIEHLENNHYFSVDETIRFELVLHTTLSPEYLSFYAEVQNVFETEVLEHNIIKDCRISYKKEAMSAQNDRYEIKVPTEFAKHKVGVYKIVFTVLYGGSEYKRVSHAFEVYDTQSDLCPPLESGLPLMFSMNNEQKKLERNAFDLWNPMPSCDFGHYIACATNTPVEAERLEVWRYLKLFGRKWFVWLAIRTCDDYLSEKHNIVLEKADYIFHTGVNTDYDPLGTYSLFPNRVDHWWNLSYNVPGVRQLIRKFFHKYPEYCLQLSYDPTGTEPFSKEQYKELIALCGQEMIDYINTENTDFVKTHNQFLRKLNPNAKRAIYGPFPQYFCPTLTWHSLRYFGIPDDRELSEEYYNGFAIFEDYPFSCSYQTYRGPFALMTLLIHLPDLTVYPELYTGSKGGCIDGAVKYAHAPMGDYDCPPYQNSTLAFEYVYNTAYKTKDGFGYWNTYGFHRGMDTCDYINQFVHNWHYVAEHKPVSPLRSTAYLISYDRSADCYTDEANYYNQGESGQTIVYECAREAGIPGGFGVTANTLKTLTAKDCDLLVIPSTIQLKEEELDEIRRLYNTGVNLIALSDITGLEDLFGVRACKKENINVNSVEYNGEKEYVLNTSGTFAYEPLNATVTVAVNDNVPAVICTPRTTLFNTAMLHLGCADPSKPVAAKGCFIVGQLIRQATKDIVTALSSPLAVGEHVGVTLFRDTNGNRMLLAIDYTPFDNREQTQKEAVIKLNMDDVHSVSCDLPVKFAKRNGTVREIRFRIPVHGSAFIQLLTSQTD